MFPDVGHEPIQTLAIRRFDTSSWPVGLLNEAMGHGESRFVFRDEAEQSLTSSPTRLCLSSPTLKSHHCFEAQAVKRLNVCRNTAKLHPQPLPAPDSSMQASEPCLAWRWTYEALMGVELGLRLEPTHG